MPVLPKTDRTLIDWVEQHIDIWKADPASIGLDGAAVTELISLLAGASAAEEAAQLARSAAQAATLRLHLEAEALREQAASMVATIKAYADTQDDPNVYSEAQIPPDRPKAPLGPPEAPHSVSATLLVNGVVRLAWKGSRKGGTFFEVYRMLTTADGQRGAPTLLTSTPDKTWTDRDLPAGLRQVEYFLIARRTGGVSDRSGLASLQFGSDGAFYEQGSTAGAASAARAA